MQITAVQNHFVSYKPCSTCVDNAISIFETCSQIVSTQNSGFGSTCQSFGAHHTDIPVCDWQDTCAAIRSRGNFIGTVSENGMSRKEWNQMFGYTNRTYTGAAATMRTGEGFMQVKMADVCTDSARIS